MVIQSLSLAVTLGADSPAGGHPGGLARSSQSEGMQSIRMAVGRGFGIFAVLCALGAAAAGLAYHRLNLVAFESNKRAEAMTALELVESFVLTYTRIQGAAPPDAGSGAPVPATFRAHAIATFNERRASGQVLNVRWVGLPGREIRTPAGDPALARTIAELAGQPEPKPVASFVQLADQAVLRIVAPSIASQASCVDCHNRIQAGRHVWRLNDVMGAFAIDVPAGPFVAANRLQAALLGLGLFLLALTVGSCIFVLNHRRVRAEVETRAHARVTEARQRFLHAIDNLSDGVAVWNADGSFLFCNDVYRRQSGAAADRLADGWDFEAYIRRSIELGEVQSATEDGQRWLDERLARHRAGGGTFEIVRDGRWMLIRESRSKDGATVIAATDISELKVREQDLLRARAAAEEANRAKSEFLANMSHELRTPLNAIIGFSEVIRGELFGPAGNARYLEYAADIHASGVHLLEVIGDILDLAKIEAGRLVLEDGMFDPNLVIEEALRTVSPNAAGAGVALHGPPPLAGLQVRGDARAFRQVLLNLLSNAVKFTLRGGRVEVRLAIDRAGALEIAVADTGIGIAPEHLELVLEPFGQVAGSFDRKTGGTGLGLPIARSLVEHSGGRLTIDSEPGDGTTVRIRLPAERVQVDGAAPAGSGTRLAALA